MEHITENFGEYLFIFIIIATIYWGEREGHKFLKKHLGMVNATNTDAAFDNPNTKLSFIILQNENLAHINRDVGTIKLAVLAGVLVWLGLSFDLLNFI